MLYVHRVNCVIHSSFLNSFLFFIPGFSKRKKTQGDASHQTRSSSAAISWMGLGERDQVFPWFTLFPLLTLKPEGLNICLVLLVYCRSQVSSCRT